MALIYPSLRRDTAHISGMAALGEKLARLPLQVKEKVAYGATLAAASTGRDAVESMAPMDTGLLARNIRVAKIKAASDWQVEYIVFVKQGTKAKSRKRRELEETGTTQAMYEAVFNYQFPYYARFVEFGTSKMDANPFMEKGFIASVDAALTRARNYGEKKVGQIVEGK